MNRVAARVKENWNDKYMVEQDSHIRTQSKLVSLLYKHRSRDGKMDKSNIDYRFTDEPDQQLLEVHQAASIIIGWYWFAAC
jgi:hypothetical protein